MSTAAQIETEWSGLNVPEGGDAVVPARVPGRAGNGAGDGNVGGTGAYPSDEEILEMDSVGVSPSRVIPNEVRNPSERFDGGGEQSKRDSSSPSVPRNDNQQQSAVGAQHAVPLQQGRDEARPTAAQGAAAAMPEWMRAVASDPKIGPEAQRQVQQLWQEHQEFRAAFASPDEARAIKELFPGGAQEARTLRQAAQAVDQIDAAIYSGDARAQSEVVAELARANPAAFRSLFAEAAKVLAGLGQGQAQPVTQNIPTLRENREEGGTRNGNGASPNPTAGTRENRQRDSSVAPASQTLSQNDTPSPENGYGVQARNAASPVTSHPSHKALRASQSPATPPASPVTNHAFDPAAYAAFERSTNDAVARDVRTAVTDTLARVLPEGVGDGAARRIGDDIFNEIHRTLAADRTLSEQVGEVLRAPLASGQGWQFGANEQARVAQLLSGRAKQLVPSVARKVIGEWTTSVLGTARNKAARQAAAASRVDIAAPGGSLDSMPLRPMSSREVNYASMSDDEILGM